MTFADYVKIGWLHQRKFYLNNEFSKDEGIFMGHPQLVK